MCPKRTFQTILETTELIKSKTYSSESSRASAKLSQREYLLLANYAVPWVAGYTGHKESAPIAQKPMARTEIFLTRPPPGYTGFIPSASSCSLFGKSYSVIASACARHVHGV